MKLEYHKLQTTYMRVHSFNFKSIDAELMKEWHLNGILKVQFKLMGSARSREKDVQHNMDNSKCMVCCVFVCDAITLCQMLRETFNRVFVYISDANWQFEVNGRVCGFGTGPRYANTPLL